MTSLTTAPLRFTTVGRLTFLLLILLTCLSFQAVGQLKYEREYRIQPSEVPASALEFVSAFPFSKKVKWYREEGLHATTIEAKTRHLGEFYSIEFDSTGLIEDIEIDLKLADIPTKTDWAITRYLQTHFLTHKVEKVQIQYVGETDALQSLNEKKPETSQQGISINYELVVRVKGKDGLQLVELLVDESGKPLKQSLIVFDNTDHLEY